MTETALIQNFALENSVRPQLKCPRVGKPALENSGQFVFFLYNPRSFLFNWQLFKELVKNKSNFDRGQVMADVADVANDLIDSEVSSMLKLRQSGPIQMGPRTCLSC